jgi:hypothetical protein
VPQWFLEERAGIGTQSIGCNSMGREVYGGRTAPPARPARIEGGYPRGAAEAIERHPGAPEAGIVLAMGIGHQLAAAATSAPSSMPRRNCGLSKLTSTGKCVDTATSTVIYALRPALATNSWHRAWRRISPPIRM